MKLAAWEAYLKHRDILRDVTFGEWAFAVKMTAAGHYLQVVFQAPDNSAPGSVPKVHKGRKWYLSHHMTKSEVVQTALMAVLAAVEHEAREQFKYKGRAIFGPHFGVDRLHALCGTDALDVRP